MTDIPPPARVYQSFAAVCPACGHRARGKSEKAAITSYERHYVWRHVP